jgi:hypothetical protein
MEANQKMKKCCKSQNTEQSDVCHKAAQDYKSVNQASLGGKLGSFGGARLGPCGSDKLTPNWRDEYLRSILDNSLDTSKHTEQLMTVMAIYDEKLRESAQKVNEAEYRATSQSLDHLEKCRDSYEDQLNASYEEWCKISFAQEDKIAKLEERIKELEAVVNLTQNESEDSVEKIFPPDMANFGRGSIGSHGPQGKTGPVGVQGERGPSGFSH